MPTIYGVKDKGTGRVVYVGQTRQNPEARWYQHITRASRLNEAMRQVGLDNFEMTILDTVDAEELNARETAWIEKLGTLHPGGLNHRPGGGASGASARARERMAEASKRAWQDPVSRENLCESRRRMWADPEYRERMAQKRREMWADPDFRARRAEAQKKAFARPEYRAARAEIARRTWSDPEAAAAIRAKTSATHKEKNRDPEYRAKQIDKIAKWRRSNQV